jgi:hypothetical protein
MSCCSWLDLQILGSQPIMPKKSPRSLVVCAFQNWYHTHTKLNVINNLDERSYNTNVTIPFYNA